MKKLLTSFLNKPVQKKLTVMVMFITFISVSAACSAFLSYYVYSTKKSMINELSLVSDIVGKRTAPGMQFMGEEFAQKAASNLADLKNNKSIIMACLFKNNGNLLAEYHSEKTMDCPEFPLNETVQFLGEHLILHQDIKSIDGKVVGSIYIKADMREIYHNVYIFTLGTLVLMVLVLIIAYFLVRQMQKIISVPVQNLAYTAQSVMEHDDYSLRAPHFYDDELGVLVDTFNSMMQEVEKTRYDLEDIVSERTKDLKDALIKAQSSNRAKSEFLRNMSHEFRTPLHGMLSFSSYGINEAGTADRNDLLRYFSRINQVAQRLLKLVEAILSIAQLESGKESFDIQEDDLMYAVQSVIKEQQALLMEKNIEVEVRDTDISTRAEFDRDKMVQVITNILGNSIKFTPSGKKIIIEFSERMFTRDRRRKSAPAISISIIDQGVGIPDDELEKIFDKFVQSSRTDTGAGGTGLGLSIAAGIIRAHDGDITASNSEENGAVFVITIPREARK